MPKEARKRKHGRLGSCDVCKAVEAQYTCPRCETVTCSLNCVKSHKKQLDCDGVRVRSKYIPMNKMNELSFLSDYRLMEDIERCVETAAAIRETAEFIPNFQHVDDTIKRSKQMQGKKQVNQEPAISVVSNEEELAKSNEEEGKKSKKGAVEDCKKEFVTKKGKRQKNRNRFNKSKEEMLVCKATKIREAIQKKKAATNKAAATTSNNVFNNESVVQTTENSSPAPDPQLVVPRPICRNPPALCEVKNLVPPTVSAMPEKNQSTNNNSRPSKIKSKAHLKNAVRTHGDRKEMVLNTLMKAAQSRGIYMSFLPKNFEKHLENTSFFFGKDNCIYWKLRLSFINANMFTLTIDECDETTILEKLIRNCLKRSQQYSRENQSEDPLAVYRTLGISAISVLMTADRLPTCHKKFYLLDKQKSLRENFIGKCIVEFPQLCIALEGCHTVCKMKDKVETRFFDFDDKDEKTRTSNSDEERFQKLVKERKQKKKIKKEKKQKTTNNNDTESGRESGELTESSSDDFSSDTEKQEELYDDSEFRSMYKDLLNTFDVDVKQVKK